MKGLIKIRNKLSTPQASIPAWTRVRTVLSSRVLTLPRTWSTCSGTRRGRKQIKRAQRKLFHLQM